jgi:ferredoxin
VAYIVTLVDRGERFEVEPGETLLAAARRAGVRLPWGCGVGACRTCAARLISGRARMPPDTALTSAHLADHLVLPCVAQAASDLEIRVGTKIGLLTPLPWTD